MTAVKRRRHATVQKTSHSLKSCQVGQPQPGNPVRHDTFISFCRCHLTGCLGIYFFQIGCLCCQSGKQRLSLAIWQLYLFSEIGGQFSNDVLNLAESLPVVSNHGKAKQRWQPVCFKRYNSLHCSAYTSRWKIVVA